MGAIRPNKNFDNERQEHTPYQPNKPVLNVQQRYNELMQKPVINTKKDIRSAVVYNKYFK